MNAIMVGAMVGGMAGSIAGTTILNINLFAFIIYLLIMFIIVIILFTSVAPDTSSKFSSVIIFLLFSPVFLICWILKKIDCKFVISKYRKRLVLMNKTKQVINNVDSQIYWVKGDKVHEKLKEVLNNLSKEDYDLVKDYYSKFVRIIK